MAALLGVLPLMLIGRNERGLDDALMLTGRWAFLLFWPAYAGSGLAALGGPRFACLKRQGRQFGLAFAAAMLVHVGLIGWLCAIGRVPAIGVFLFFGPCLACIYALALFSLPAMKRKLSAAAWRLLRFLSMNYIAFAFATDFFKSPFGGGLKHVALYAPFAVLSALGFVAYSAAQLASTRKAQVAT